MGRQDVMELEQVARLLHRAASAGPEGTTYSDHLDHLSRVCYLVQDLPHDVSLSSPEGRRRLMLTVASWRGVLNRGIATAPTAGPFQDGTAAVRAVRHAWCVLRGRADDIPDHLRGMVRQALGTSDDYGHLADAVPDGRGRHPTRAHPSTVTFSYAYAPRGWRPGEPLCLGQGEVPLRSVEAIAAPVVARLNAGGGLRLDLRAVDGRLHRPVLSPGRWTPVGVAEFADAARSGEAWVDNPFLTLPPWDASVGDLADVAFGPGDGSRADVKVSGAVRQACLERCGDLVVVDGLVYRPTVAPTLHLTYRRVRTGLKKADPLSLRMAWRMGDLEEFTSQSVDRVAVLLPVNDLLDGPMPWLGEMPVTGRSTMGVGLGDATALDGFVGQFHADPGRTSSVKAPDRTGALPFEILDHAAFPSDPLCVARVVAAQVAADRPGWAALPTAGTFAAHLTVGDHEAAAAALEAMSRDVMRTTFNRPRGGYDHNEHGLSLQGAVGVRILCEAARAQLLAAPTPEPDLDEAVTGMTL